MNILSFIYRFLLTLQMPMWSILHVTMTSLVAVVALRTGKIIKNNVFLKEEKICYQMVYYTLYLS